MKKEIEGFEREEPLSKKIIVVGPGAMGCLFAGLLIEAGQENVWLLDRRKERAKEIARNGLSIEGIGGTRRILGAKVTADPQEIGFADLTILCVKSYDTEEALHSILPAIGDNTTVLTLQNGLTNVEIISRILVQALEKLEQNDSNSPLANSRGDKVVAGVTSHGATALGNGHIRHAGAGETVIGEPRGGTSARTEAIAGILRSAGFQTTISTNIYNSIWGKLIINAAINPLTAITKLRNGELLEYGETRRLLSMTAEEAAQVAVDRGISLPYENATSAVEAVCEATSSNISSMLQDVLRQKRTEIDAINGAIVNEARKAGIEAPINETLTYLVKAVGKGHKLFKPLEKA